MPKMKSHSGTKKRFRKTGTGKLMRAKAFKSHILSKKSTKRKRTIAKEIELEDKIENMGAELIKEAASRTNDAA